ncbi:hypothetical protein XENTR_v90030153mg [Pelobates cultripes]|uniref:Ubiquitin-like protease family profile domain-containing protein n=1 Tax=Pelobates cultripes TaxID=61616 RepID=A0AAD1VY88_PELCU|nr:hypothetical protein XENTR_v90030153mg [Pelobates cultripes]
MKGDGFVVSVSPSEKKSRKNAKTLIQNAKTIIRKIKRNVVKKLEIYGNKTLCVQMKVNKRHIRCQKKPCVPQKEQPVSGITIQDSCGASINQGVTTSNTVELDTRDHLRGCSLNPKKQKAKKTLRITNIDKEILHQIAAHNKKEVLHKSETTLLQELYQPIVPDKVGESTFPQNVNEPTVPDEVGESTFPQNGNELTVPDEVDESTFPQNVNEPTMPDEVGESTFPQNGNEPTMPAQVDKRPCVPQKEQCVSGIITQDSCGASINQGVTTFNTVELDASDYLRGCFFHPKKQKAKKSLSIKNIKKEILHQIAAQFKKEFLHKSKTTFLQESYQPIVLDKVVEPTFPQNVNEPIVPDEVDKSTFPQNVNEPTVLDEVSEPTFPQNGNEPTIPAQADEQPVSQETGPSDIPEKDQEPHTDVHCVDKKQDGQWLPWLNLTHEHKDIIINDKWLDDTIIDAAQTLLKMQFDTDGLQSCVLAQIGMTPVTREAVQIHYDANRHHWFTTAFKKGIVEVVDSLRTSHLSSSARREIGQFYGNVMKNPLKRVHMRKVDQQPNYDDCGVFAIANAFELLSGRNATCKYLHHQMRKHLISCLENGKITEFPKKF